MEQGALRIEVVRDLAALDEHAVAWDALTAASPPHRPTHAHAWVCAYLEHRLAPGADWQCVLAFEEDALVGVLPLARRGRLLSTLRDDHTPSGDAVVRVHGGEILPALVRAHCEAAPGVDVIAFEGWVPTSPTSTWLARTSDPLVQRGAFMTGATIDTAVTFEERLAGLSGNARSKLRKGERLLAETGDVTTTFTTDAAALPAAFATFQEIEAATWKGAQGTAIARDDALRAFYDTLVARLGARGWLRVHTLSVGGNPVASELVVTCGPTAVVHKVAFDETHRKASPGNLIWARTLQWACEDPVITKVDLLAMDELVARWGAVPYEYATTSWFRRGLASTLRSRWPAMLRARLAAARRRGTE